MMTPEEREKIKSKKPRESLEQMSDTMKDMLYDLCQTSSLNIKCEYCGRVYFCERGDYEDGELETLKECAELNPDMYIETGHDDYTAWGYINGLQYVWNCECNGPLRVENFIWSHKGFIAKYLQTRSSKELEEAQKNMEIVNTIKIKTVSEFEIEGDKP